VIAGVSFLAFANGAPDIMTAIIAGSSSSPLTVLIPFGSIFGACLFGTAFILSTVILCQPNCVLEVRRREIIVPTFFYIFGIIVIILVTTFYGKMNLFISIGLIATYFM
jgi:sodium/potassium/calcium exchanger 6